ncbi:MAG: plasmid pRiA4b ORF-3 family protein [Proteobacteria bacterium]|nr:plasmid pRiA4b ORF-3 family protein [Pseudomonadota bacterium]
MTVKTLRSTYRIKITLAEIRPPIWRRVLINSATKLSDLHEILQIAMGWTDSHLHLFEKDGKRYGVPDEEFPDDTLNEENFRINQLLKKEKDAFNYEYDFGDGWMHKVILEKVLPFDTKATLPHCMTGKRNCPPEDVGGTFGYANFLEAMSDKNHPEHEDMMDWIGGEFDPEEFDVDVVNQILYDQF